MRILAILNQKGGSGKTTTAVNLAATLAEAGKKILLLDMDPQGSASRWYGYKDQGKGLFSLLTEEVDIKAVIKKTSVKNLDVIPSSPMLSSAEKILLSEAGAEMILKEHLEKITNYDYVLIDCPPSLNALTLNALTAAKELLIPVETHVMALHGLVQLIKTIGHVKKRLNPSLKIAGILPCRVDIRTKHAREVLAQLTSRFEGQVFSTIIRENIKLAEAPLHLKPIIHYDNSCYGSLDYRGLAKEVLKQEKTI
jgi:chromosome partitioning protein